MKNSIIYISLALVLILVLAIFLNKRGGGEPGKLDSFASCLKDKGAIFYGAFWCPHCRDQKQMFGKSVSFLPYVECSTPDGQNQLPICKEKNITSYPTWDFISGTTTERFTGTLTLETLAEKTSCQLSQ